MTRYHLIGIGGSGLSAIALVLLESGEEVTGSDQQRSPQIQELEDAGARITLEHRPENVLGVDVVLRSSAIPEDNVEIQAALKAGIPVLKRVDFMQRLVEDREVIAVAGTHGKTTTTAMIAWILTVLKMDPAYIIGGKAVDLGRNAHAGQGEYFVIEADEYDRMFLGLRPALAVVTNVEHDHPDCFPTQEEYRDAFEHFVSRIEPDGVLIACGDDPGGADLLGRAKKAGRRVCSYGIGEHHYDYWARSLVPSPDSGYIFDVYKRDRGWAAEVWLQVPGEHNVLNALATMIVADLLGLNLQNAAEALGNFKGTGRRFEVRGAPAGVTIIDDYAHHPTEIRATLKAARARYPDRSLWVVWQPHTYTRTRTMLDEFVKAFEGADNLLLTDIYAAREAPPEDGFSVRDVVDAISSWDTNVQTYYTPRLSQAQDLLVQKCQTGDVVLVLSAGDAVQISEGLLWALSERENRRLTSKNTGFVSDGRELNVDRKETCF